jgi:hypothetical protein
VDHDWSGSVWTQSAQLLQKRSECTEVWEMQQASCISGARTATANASAGLLVVDFVRFFRVELFRIEQQ